MMNICHDFSIGRALVTGLAVSVFSITGLTRNAQAAEILHGDLVTVTVDQGSYAIQVQG
jgi:hypothetical protein